MHYNSSILGYIILLYEHHKPIYERLELFRSLGKKGKKNTRRVQRWRCSWVIHSPLNLASSQELMTSYRNLEESPEFRIKMWKLDIHRRINDFLNF